MQNCPRAALPGLPRLAPTTPNCGQMLHVDLSKCRDGGGLAWPFTVSGVVRPTLWPWVRWVLCSRTLTLNETGPIAGVSGLAAFRTVYRVPWVPLVCQARVRVSAGRAGSGFDVRQFASVSSAPGVFGSLAVRVTHYGVSRVDHARHARHASTDVELRRAA